MNFKDKNKEKSEKPSFFGRSMFVDPKVAYEKAVDLLDTQMKSLKNDQKFIEELKKLKSERNK